MQPGNEGEGLGPFDVELAGVIRHANIKDEARPVETAATATNLNRAALLLQGWF